MHQKMAATLDTIVVEIRAIQKRARAEEIPLAPAMADDRAAQPQRLDRAQDGGWQTD